LYGDGYRLGAEVGLGDEPVTVEPGAELAPVCTRGEHHDRRIGQSS